MPGCLAVWLPGCLVGLNYIKTLARPVGGPRFPQNIHHRLSVKTKHNSILPFVRFSTLSYRCFARRGALETCEDYGLGQKYKITFSLHLLTWSSNKAQRSVLIIRNCRYVRPLVLLLNYINIIFCCC